jgi:hypothetical protein
MKPLVKTIQYAAQIAVCRHIIVCKYKSRDQCLSLCRVISSDDNGVVCNALLPLNETRAKARLRKK